MNQECDETQGLARLPDFLYVGGRKCGSTWLYKALGEHPEIFVPPAKDIMYFDRHYDRPLSWYAEFFRDASGYQTAGELTHDYFISRTTAQRILKHLPEVKIIICLREPFDRVMSEWLWERANRLSSAVSFSEFAFQPKTLAESDYIQNLGNFYGLFPRENIGTFFYDDLCADPLAFIRSIYSFLGTDPNFVPRCLNERVLAARKPRWTFLAHRSYAAAQVMRQFGGANLVGRVKHNSLFENLLYVPLLRRPEVPREQILQLRGRFSAGYGALEAMIGRPLPDAWRQ